MAELNYSERNELKPEGKLIKKIGFKPYTACIISWVVSALMIIPLNLILIILAVFFAGMSLFVYLTVKDYPTIDIYEKGVVIYKLEDGSKAVYIPYTEIVEWTLKQTNSNSSDAMFFKLADDTTIYKDTYQAPKAYYALKKLINEKESKVLQAEKNKNQKLHFVNPFKKKNKID